MGSSIISNIRQSPVIFFLLKLTILISVLFSLDFLIGNTLSHFYFKQESGLHYRTTYSIEKTNADILVFGSSRANHHYHPDIFEENLKLSYYNVGRDGNFIVYHYAVLKGILKRYKPKIIILDFVNEEFIKKQETYDRLSALLPYYKNHPEMQAIIELKSPFEKLKLTSSIYPFNSSLLTIAAGNSEFNKKRKTDYKGYIPLMKKWNNSIENENNPDKYELDTIKIKLYESFIKDCVENNVKLYVVCSPYFIKFKNKDLSIRLGKRIANKHEVQFFDYTEDTLFTNKQNIFADPVHLNEEGSKTFSKKLAKDIIQFINKKTDH